MPKRVTSVTAQLPGIRIPGLPVDGQGVNQELATPNQARPLSALDYKDYT
jgi:hypothetical protein